jgi:biopolymer transport protein ExbB
MKNPGMVIIVLLVFLTPGVDAQSLDELARQVREAAASEAKINQEREAAFVLARDEQDTLLSRARQELAAENSRSDELREDYDRNEITLAELETTLDERMGNLGELFGVVRLVSGDVKTLLDDSMVSAQFPGRTRLLADLAERRELPTVPELEQMWSLMVTEIAESGKVIEFTAAVERKSGEKQEMEVVRLGVFNAVADGKFLDWDIGRSKENLIELGRQPATRFVNMAQKLQDSPEARMMPFAVDFTRGQILRAVVQTKTPLERVSEDGGPIAYVIVGVGIFGLLLCLWKMFSLYSAGRRVSQQMIVETVDESNPLGRVLAVYEQHPDTEVANLELRLDEAILRETAPIEAGLSFIRVLYVVAPLLGLLGTVIGMISTFQMITLFGTGDPRMMAGGISTALVTTVLGLVVAIPLTLLHSFLSAKAKSLIQVLEEQAAGMIAKRAERRI